MLEAMRLVSWNIQLGRRLDAVEGALAKLAAEAPLDLVALQEASVHAGVEDAQAIAARLGPSYVGWQVTAQHLRGEPQANAVVWDTARVAIEARDVLELPTPAGRVLRALPPSRRSALRIEGTAGGTPFRLHVVHLDVLGLTHKVAQFRTVLEDARRRPPIELAIIAGDLNTYGPARLRPWTVLDRAAASTGYREVTAEAAWTHAAGRLRQKLDADFVSPPGTPAAGRVLPIDASAHRPLLVELG